MRLHEISHSGQLILGALFFKHVFGAHGAAKILVVLSCMGNISSVISHVSSCLPSSDLRIADTSVGMSDVITDGSSAYFCLKSLVRVSYFF